MAVVFQKDKRSGITYAYESKSWWDKEKRQSRSKRTLIGRVDKDTGKIVPTDGRCRKKKGKEALKTIKDNLLQGAVSKRKFFGATYLLDVIGKKTGVTADLKQCFPNDYKRILSIAYFLILEDNNPLSRFEKWGTLHKHPYDQIITSQRSSELFASITEDRKEKFFRLQGRRRAEKEYWAYDITSISSYSKQLKEVKYGKNKENDRLPQINLALVFGEKSGLPFYYRHFAGNIPDSKTIRSFLAELKVLGFRKIKLVTDRGFYSKSNVDMLYKDHLKFLMSVKMNLKIIKEALDPIYDNFRSFDHYNDSYEVYFHTVKTEWDYEQHRPNKGDILKSKKRIYIHYYFNITKAAEEEKSFDKKLIELKHELESGNRDPKHEKQYAKYFQVASTPKRGAKVTIKQEEVNKTKRYYGFFALLTNEPMDAVTALELYRTKDITEKGFNNIKDRLNMRRALVSSEESLRGKLFVEFVALIYLSYIKKQMQLQNLFREYTLQGALDQLDLIECFEHNGKKIRVGEVLEKQKTLYKMLDVKPPFSL